MKSKFLYSLLLLSCLAYGQDRAARLDSLLTARFNDGSFNGNILVAEKGNIIFEKSYGFANLETGTKLNTNSVFELASVSKQFTAMAIVLLQKQGKLQYDDKISKYIPELAFYGDITVRNLLNHTGGLPDYMELFEKHWDKSKFAVNQDIMDLFAKHKPAAVFSPGEKFEYSNTGYALLATIIERASKKSFGDYLQANIFKPLKMENTLVYRSRYKPQAIKNYAMGYVTDSIGKLMLPDSFGKAYYTYYLDGIVGDGMVNSTIHDLLKWDRALYTDKLVSQKDKDLIFNGVVTKDGNNTNYGFGWMIPPTDKYGKRMTHSGGWAGYITYIERGIEKDYTIILLQNNGTPKTKIPSADVRKILHNEKLDVAAQAITLKPEELLPYLGTYATTEFPMKIIIAKNDKGLTAQATGQSAFPLDAYGNHKFGFKPAEIKVEFKPAENVMILDQGGSAVVFKKE